MHSTAPSPLDLPVTVDRTASAFRDPEGLADRVAHFMLRMRQFPDLPHAALAIGKYYVVEKIDEGAMGLVCKAIAEDLGTVAIKIPKALGDRRLRERVLREGQLLARVHHTHVLRIHEVGECDGEIYIVSEYVEGQTLRTWQSAAGRDWRAIVRAYLQAGLGLAAIHARQIVHQDIKPDNIRVDEHGTVRVLDFGLAHLETHLLAESLTRIPDEGARTGTAPTFYRGGTPGYMAPEQYRHDRPIDARADQFAFCAALWEALHGHLPYSADAIASTVVGTPRRPLGPPRTTRRGGAPRWLDALLQRGLAEDPERRHPDMHALVTAIDRRLSRRTWPLLLAGGIAGLGGAIVSAVMAAPDLPMCGASEATVATLQAERREPELAAVAATLTDEVAARSWALTRDLLAARSRRWSELHDASCRRAIDVDDPAVVLTREPCFVARRAEMSAVADAMLAFAGRHAGDPRAPWDAQRERWADQLRPIEDCLTAQPAALAPDNAIDDLLEAASAAVLVDDLVAARPLLERALAAADAAGDRRRGSRARLELGRVAIDQHDNHAAERLLSAAVRDAEAGGDDLTAADADGWLVHVVGDRSDHPHAATLLFDRGMGRLERLGLEHSARAFDLHLRTANAARRIGDLDDATRLLDRATTLRERLGPDELRLAREEQHRAELASARGDLKTARAATRSALARFRGTLGSSALSVGMCLRRLGQLAREADDLAAAEGPLLAALAIFQARSGATSIDAATVHTELATLYTLLEKPAEARHHAEASAPLELDGEPRHRAFQAQQAAARGEIELRFNRDHTLAAQHYRRGIALAEVVAVSRAERRNLALMRLGLAQAELAASRPHAAEEALRPLVARVDDPSVVTDLRLYVLLMASEVAIAADDRALAADRARLTLAGLSAAERRSSALAAEALWLLARALGPRADGLAAAAEARAMLRSPEVAAGSTIEASALDEFLRRR